MQKALVGAPSTESRPTRTAVLGAAAATISAKCCSLTLDALSVL